MKELIKASALKWWAIMKRNEEDLGRRNCALCKEYYSDWGTFLDYCKGCSVSLFTQQNFCYGTPYDDWINHHGKYHYHERTVKCPECYNLARDEFLFLCKLCRKVKYENEMGKNLYGFV